MSKPNAVTATHKTGGKIIRTRTISRGGEREDYLAPTLADIITGPFCGSAFCWRHLPGYRQLLTRGEEDEWLEAGRQRVQYLDGSAVIEIADDHLWLHGLHAAEVRRARETGAEPEVRYETMAEAPEWAAGWAPSGDTLEVSAYLRGLSKAWLIVREAALRFKESAAAAAGGEAHLDAALHAGRKWAQVELSDPGFAGDGGILQIPDGLGGQRGDASTGRLWLAGYVVCRLMAALSDEGVEDAVVVEQFARQCPEDWASLYGDDVEMITRRHLEYAGSDQ